MKFGILGPLEAVRDGRRLAIGGRIPRTILALLLLDAGSVVSDDRLIEHAWAGDPPSGAAAALRTHVSRLGAVLHRELTPGEPKMLVRRPPGYVLEIAPDQLDARQFEQLALKGKEALAAMRSADAAEALSAALDLWRGRALAEFDGIEFARIEIARLESQRLDAEEALVHAELLLGRHRQLVGKLERLVTNHPDHEGLTAQLMLALYRSDRPAEALAVYRAFHGLVRSEYGIEPGSRLQDLHRAILQQDPQLDWNAGPRLATEGSAPTPIVVHNPADLFQLPSTVSDFTGREDSSAALRALLERHTGPSTVAISAVEGQGGVGKSTLAIRVANEVKHRFPDAQLYADMRGEAVAPEPADVLAEFLRALGVELSEVPGSLAAREALYRARTRDRRVLVVLDNVTNEEQVRPFQPSGEGSALLVTSRRHLGGLDGVVTYHLQVMEEPHALELLEKIVGRERIDTDRIAAVRLVRLCAGLPLAVRLAGARLAGKPHWSLEAFTAMVEDEQRRLSMLSAGDRAIRACFALSYQDLSGEEQRAFRLLGLLDAPDFATWIAAALFDCDVVTAADRVEALVDARLVQPAVTHTPGPARYRLHDLLRVFARECLRDEEPAASRDLALERALGAYLALTVSAVRRLGLDYYSIELLPAAADAGDHPLAHVVADDPSGWFASEQESLTAAVTQAYSRELWQTTWELGNALGPLFEARRHWAAWDHANALALKASHRADDRHAEAYTQLSIGRVARSSGLGDVAAAKAHHSLEQALALFDEAGDLRGSAYVRLEIGVTYRYHGRFDEALTEFAGCRPMFRAAGDKVGEAAAIRNLGIIRRHHGEFDEAVRCLTHALHLFERNDQPLAAALTLRHLAVIQRHTGNLEEALATTTQGFELCVRLKNRSGEALMLRTLGQVHRARKDYERAHEVLAQALEIYREIGDPGAEGWTFDALGAVYREQGHHERAKECFEECLDRLAAVGGRIGQADALLGLGRSDAALGLHKEAFESFQRSLDIYREAHLPLKEGRVLLSLGSLYDADGDRARRGAVAAGGGHLRHPARA